jgi:hypothetical protein
MSPLGPGRPAALAGYRLTFNKKSTEDLSGKANVTAREGSEVWGVLYTVSARIRQNSIKARAAIGQ